MYYIRIFFIFRIRFYQLLYLCEDICMSANTFKFGTQFMIYNKSKYISFCVFIVKMFVTTSEFSRIIYIGICIFGLDILRNAINMNQKLDETCSTILQCMISLSIFHHISYIYHIIIYFQFPKSVYISLDKLNFAFALICSLHEMYFIV